MYLSAADWVQPVVVGKHRELSVELVETIRVAELVALPRDADVVVVQVAEVEGVGGDVHDRPDDDHVGHRLVEGQVLVELTPDAPST